MLDAYSQAQERKLFELRTEWREYCSEHPDGYLLCQVPSPGNQGLVLFLYTANEEMTLAFGPWEWTYPEPTGLPQDELALSLAMIDQIQKEEVFVVSYWNGDVWLGSTLNEPNEPFVASGISEGAKSAKVLSWSGKQNREVPL